ncbi:6-phospho-beta-glucosidase, partial [Enterococcus faecium]
ELFIAHQQYLPQFKETICLLKEVGIEVQDELARELSSNTHIMEEV